MPCVIAFFTAPGGSQTLDKTSIIVIIFVVIFAILTIGIILLFTVRHWRDKNKKNPTDYSREPFIPPSSTDSPLTELFAEGTGSGSGIMLK